MDTNDLAKKTEAMLEFRKYRDSGLPVPPEVRARHVWATNDGYATGPDAGQTIPVFSLPDQTGAVRSLGDLAGPRGLLLVFHRSAGWCQYCRSQLVELELSRGLLEKSGVRIAAVSYDSQETLAAFAREYSIGYPLLSDAGSKTIRSFGIFNENMARHLKAYGVPHPVEYLVSPDGVVLEKYFVPNYMYRVTGASVALAAFSAVAEDAASVRLSSDALKVTIGLPSRRAFSGQEIGFFAKFSVASGWHTYGPGVQDGYTATSVSFDEEHLVRQSFRLPDGSSTLAGEFEGKGTLLLRQPLPEGPLVLRGRLDAQLCSETVCEAPMSIPFELTMELEPFAINARDRKLLEQKAAERG